MFPKSSPVEVMPHGKPDFLGKYTEEFRGFGIFSRTAPEEFGYSRLSQSVIRQHNLTDGYITRSHLSKPEECRDCKLGDSRQAKYKLSETKQETDTQLSNGDNTDTKLTDGNHTLGHAHLALGIPAKCNVH